MEESSRPPSRRPKNEAEGMFYDLASSKGWDLTKRGWPDYFVSRDGEIVLVEVKASAGRKLREDRQEVMYALANRGIPCFVWSPDGGFEEVAGIGGKGVASTLGPSTTSPKDQRHRGESEGNTAPFESPRVDPPRNGNDATRLKVKAVWDHYVAVMKPRGVVPGDDDRRLIRSALAVASVDELCRAIDGCAASPFHMGRNDRQKKYNRLSQIVKGRKGKETTRERIDFFLDIADKSSLGASGFPSGDAGVIQQKKRSVQRGWRFREDAKEVHEAEEAEAWLREHGIEVLRREADGYPTFRPLGAES